MQFYTLYEQNFSNLRPLLYITFPQGFQKLKFLDIGLWEVVAKRPLNGVRKCDGQTSTQTNTQTNTQTDIRTFRLIERIGPEGRFFEKEIKQLAEI